MAVLILYLLSLLHNKVNGQTADSLACLSSEGCDLIVGGGSAAVADMIEQWGLFFGMERPNVNLQYVPSEGIAMDYIQKKCLKPGEAGYDGLCFHNHTYFYDYAVTDHNPKNQLSTLENDGLIIEPIYSAAVVLAHKVAGYTVDNPLLLSRELVYKIFNFEITNWADPEIANFNHGPKLPNATIKVVLRSDENGLTKTMTHFFKSVDPEWPYNESLTWPAPTAGNPNVLSAKGPFATTNAVLTHPNSIGYVPLNYAVTAGLAYALVQNKAGNIVQPQTQGLQAALVATMDGGDETLDPADADGEDSYPLSLTAYIVMLKQAESDCPQRAQMFKFWNWCLTDPSAVAHASSNPGFSNLPDSVVEKVLKELHLGTCNGVESLAMRYAESSVTPLRVALIVISVLSMFMPITTFFLLVWKRENRIVKATGLIFAGMMLSAFFLNYLGVVMWALVPYNPHICNARLVVVVLGCSVAAMALFTKTWTVYNIWTHMSKQENSRFEEVPPRQLGMYSAAMIGFQVLVLFLWIGTTFGVSTIQVIDPIDLVAVHLCAKDGSIWPFLELAYLAIFVLWTMWLCTKTQEFWTKHQLPNESQNILSSIFNGIFWTCVLLPMLSIIKGSPETTFFLIAVALHFPTSFAFFNIFMPKLLFIFDTNPATNKIASFLSGGDQAAYRPPASSMDQLEDPSHRSDAGGQTPMLELTRTIRTTPTDLPTVEEKEAKKDSPLVWYRQLDHSVPTSETGAVVSETGREESPSKSSVAVQEDTNAFFQQRDGNTTLGWTETSRVVKSTSLDMIRTPSITEE